jgi:hypothetical protein
LALVVEATASVVASPTPVGEATTPSLFHLDTALSHAVQSARV